MHGALRVAWQPLPLPLRDHLPEYMLGPSICLPRRRSDPRCGRHTNLSSSVSNTFQMGVPTSGEAQPRGTSREQVWPPDPQTLRRLSCWGSDVSHQCSVKDSVPWFSAPGHPKGTILFQNGPRRPGGWLLTPAAPAGGEGGGDRGGRWGTVLRFPRSCQRRPQGHIASSLVFLLCALTPTPILCRRTPRWPGEKRGHRSWSEMFERRLSVMYLL